MKMVTNSVSIFGIGVQSQIWPGVDKGTDIYLEIWIPVRKQVGMLQDLIDKEIEHAIRRK